MALCCSHTLRCLHKGCIDATFSTAGILANNRTLWRPCGSVLISYVSHFVLAFVELLVKVTPDFTHQPDCSILCCCVLAHWLKHTYAQAVKKFNYIRMSSPLKLRSCKYNKAVQIGEAGNSEMPCYLIYREQTCTRNTAGSCVRVSRSRVRVCVTARGGGG